MMIHGKKILTPDEKEEIDRVEKGISELDLGKKFQLYKLAIKYYFAGDDWDFAKAYAFSLIKNWR